MIAPFLVPLLFAQSGIELPLAGFVRAPQGWYELYGIRGNFLAGERLGDDVLSAAAFGEWRVWKTEGELVVRSAERTDRIAAPGETAWFAWSGRALFALADFQFLPRSAPGKTEVADFAGDRPGLLGLYRWQPADGWRSLGPLASGREPLGFSGGPEALTILTAHHLARYRLDGTFLDERTREPVPAALDSHGALWTWEANRLRRGGETWEFTEPIRTVSALLNGSMIVSHGDRHSMVTPGSAEAALLPVP